MAGQWFSLGTPVSSTNKTDRYDIPVTEILLKVASNTINLNQPNQYYISGFDQTRDRTHNHLHSRPGMVNITPQRQFMHTLMCGLWCLTAPSTMFQLYRGGQFYWRKKPGDPEKTTILPKVSDKHNVVSSTPRLSGIRTHNVSSDRH